MANNTPSWATIDATGERICVRRPAPDEFTDPAKQQGFVRVLPDGLDAFDLATGDGFYTDDELIIDIT